MPKALRRRFSVRSVHREERGDLVGLGVAADEPRAQHAAHLLREVVAVARLERVDLLLQHAVQLGIGTRQAAIQPIGGERHRILLGVEDQRCPEEPAKRPDTLRLAVRKLDLGGFPIGAAERAHDVEERGKRTVPGLVGGLDTRLMDFVAQHRRVAIHRQGRSRPADVKMRVAHEAAQRRSDIRRVLHEQAHEPQGVQSAVLTHQEAEMPAAGRLHTTSQQTAPGRVGNQVVGVVEQLRVKPRVHQHLGRICAQAPEDRRKSQSATDAKGRFGTPAPRALLSRAIRMLLH